ncbi:MAG TPA: DUF1214 domain-containing protein [Spirochaetota bacterium]|nr:DUF1214 domain-containing protein [Spirochaetota bacterium]HPG52240.1 DUF1214 domain-containing protein [Spirochaetota bacterium]HPN14093.1 DUF1214 domain-containing protein [Spirochaetota bacterium]HQL82996.1 DUF1214 domain-containing protein [Spirochaetota bacterium]
MKKLLSALAITAAALLLGAGSFALAIAYPRAGAMAGSGPWQTDLTVGSAQTGPYMRARIAIMGLFALRKTEAVYYIARADSAGDPLDANYDYRIEGRDVPARWWSITALGWDFHLIPNEAGLYSFNWANVKRKPDGSYVIRLSPHKKEGNWLPAGAPDGGSIALTLRLYRPEPAVLEKPGSVDLPRIIREGRP